MSKAPDQILVRRRGKLVPMNKARRVVAAGRYFYVNPMGKRHACNAREGRDAGTLLIIFGRDEVIPREHLKGEFYYRS